MSQEPENIPKIVDLDSETTNSEEIDDSLVRLNPEKMNSFEGKSQDVDPLLDQRLRENRAEEVDQKTQNEWGDEGAGINKKSLVGWALLVIATLIAIVLWSVKVGQIDDEKMAGIQSSDETLYERIAKDQAEQESEQVVMNSESVESKILQTLNGFYGAETLEELQSYSRSFEGLEARMRDHYSKELESLIKLEVATYRILESELIEVGNGSFLPVFTVKVNFGPNDFGAAVLCEEENGEIRVDWGATVGYQEIDVSDLGSLNRSQSFFLRGAVTPVRFDLDGYSPEKYLCLRLSAPGLKDSCYAYLPLDNPMLVEKLGPAAELWGKIGPTPKRVTLRLKLLNRISNTYLFEVTDIHSWSWLGEPDPASDLN